LDVVLQARFRTLFNNINAISKFSKSDKTIFNALFYVQSVIFCLPVKS